MKLAHIITIIAIGMSLILLAPSGSQANQDANVSPSAGQVSSKS